jgi:hypothetical protein
MIGRITLLLCAGLAISASAADESSRLRYRKDLDRGPAVGDEILAVPLDDEVYAASRDGFPDLRIFDDRDAEVPFVIETIRRMRTIETHEACPSGLVTLNVQTGKALEVVVSLDKNVPAADGATVCTPLTDFERRVQVYGSRERDGDAWTLLTADGRIFDFSRFMDVRNLDVAFPPNGFRRFKFVIAQEQDERESPFHGLIRDRVHGDREREVEVATILRRPFRIDRIELWRKVQRTSADEEETIRFPVVDFDARTLVAEKVSHIDVETGRQPLTGLRIQTSSRNFSRPARVLVPAEPSKGGGWVEIGRGTLARFAFRDFHREELSIRFDSERRFDRCQIVIENADNPPIDVTGVEGEGPKRRIVFLGVPERTYRLFYSSDSLEAPRYDVGTVLAAIGRDRRRAVATLGPQMPNASYREARDRPSRFDGVLFLTSAIVVMVVILVWILLGADERLKKLPVDDLGS